MHNFTSKPIILLVLAIILSFMATPLVLYLIYNEGVAVAKEQFNNNQSFIAEQISLGIEKDVKYLVRELEMLSKEDAIKHFQIADARILLKDIFAHVKPLSVNDIGLVDAKGVVRLALFAEQLEGKDFSFRKYFQEAKALTVAMPTYEFITFKGVEQGDKGILVAMPVFPLTEKFGGVILFTVKVHELINRELFSSAQEGRLAWVVDSDGNYLYHPHYSPGMKSGGQQSSDGSFERFIDTITNKPTYQAEYLSPEGEEVLAASQTVEVGEQTWSIVVATPITKVKSLIAHFTLHFSQGILLILLLVAVETAAIIFLFSRWNRALHLEILEREKVEEALTKAHSELEVRVINRTADLKSANEKLQWEIAERKRAEGILRTIAEGVSGVTGEVFFVSLVKHLTDALGMDCALIGRFTDDERSVIETLAVSVEGQIVDNFSFKPPEKAISNWQGEHLSCQMSEVRKLFPEDFPPMGKGDEECFGTLLFDSQGVPMGVILMIGATPLADPVTAESIRRIFAARVSAEIERIKREEALLEARNLESIGRLAAGLAHEINNPLTNVSLVLQMLGQELDGNRAEETLAKRLKFMERNVNRAALIAEELLLFSRQREVEFLPVNIQETIASSLTMLTFDLSNIHVTQHHAEGLELLGDPLKIEGLFINLLNNAAEAVSNGGKIDIATEFRENHIIIEITDTGVGMSAEDISKAFDPFFTTKEVGAGTGLGLSVCYATVKQHNGTIQLTSVKGKGTKVTIRFPAHQRSSE